MANYTFETITDAQAASFNHSSDTLNFSDQNATNTSVKVSYVFNAGDATHPSSYTYVVTDTNEGVSKTFGSNAFPTTATFLNGELIAGGTTGSNITDTTGTSDAIFSGPGADLVDASANSGASLWLQGNGGADSLLGGLGNDTLFGGQGADTIVSNSTGHGHGYVNGNLGDDSILGGSNGDTLFGGQGNDSIAAGSGNDLVNGNLGNDVISSASGTDTLYGGQGNDSINAGGTNDLINGNLGNDTITLAETAHGTVHGGQGDDVITVTGGTGSYVFGDLGADSITVSGANDTISGGDGNDTIVASGATSFNIDGGTGDNVISVTHAASATGDVITAGDGVNHVTVSLTANGLVTGNDLITLGNGNDTVILHDTSTVTGAAFGGNDTIVVGNGADSIDVSTHNSASGESIVAGSGADTILGGAGNDTIVAGDGNDQITLVGHSGGVEHVTVGAGHATLTAGVGQDLFTKSSSGSDLFVLGGHSSFTQGLQDTITGWSSTDSINFGLAVPVTAFVDTTPHTPVTDYASAITEANYQFSHNSENVVAVQVGSDVVVFADMNHNGTLDGSDQAVVLVGRTLSDVHTSNIVG